MRYFYVVFLLFCWSNIFSQNSYYPKYDSLKREYQVLSIKKTKAAYLINIVDSSGIRFSVVSIKCKKQIGIKIEVGKKYDLLLYSIYPPPEEGIILVGGNLIYHEFLINGIKIKFQGDFDTGILVKSPNLKELYFIEPDVNDSFKNG